MFGARCLAAKNTIARCVLSTVYCHTVGNSSGATKPWKLAEETDPQLCERSRLCADARPGAGSRGIPAAECPKEFSSACTQTARRFSFQTSADLEEAGDGRQPPDDVLRQQLLDLLKKADPGTLQKALNVLRESKTE